VSEGVINIRCLEPGCGYFLFPDDVERLGNVLDVRRYKELVRLIAFRWPVIHPLSFFLFPVCVRARVRG
jgi:hypothetical protein